MIHVKRHYRVVTLATIPELAEKLTRHSWCLCNGFQLAAAAAQGLDLLFLNDAFSEDGAQEFAVINRMTGRQVESLTCSWMTTEECETAIQRLVSGDTSGDMGPCTPLTNHPTGTCNHCA
jgi:hypothetical protein